MSTRVNTILGEIEGVFRELSVPEEQEFISQIVAAEKIVCVGAGRVGFAVAGFAKRLRHLGKESFWIDDKTLPRMGNRDLMFVASGSGETESIVTYGRIAKREGLSVALLTASHTSRLSQLADVTVVIPSSHPARREVFGSSCQPMTTLFEQCCQLYLDSVVLELMRVLGVSNEQMVERHNGIE